MFVGILSIGKTGRVTFGKCFSVPLTDGWTMIQNGPPANFNHPVAYIQRRCTAIAVLKNIIYNLHYTIIAPFRARLINGSCRVLLSMTSFHPELRYYLWFYTIDHDTFSRPCFLNDVWPLFKRTYIKGFGSVSRLISEALCILFTWSACRIHGDTHSCNHHPIRSTKSRKGWIASLLKDDFYEAC